MTDHYYSNLLIAVFVIGYLFIALEHILRVNKAATVLLIAVLCWILNFMQAFPHYQGVMLQMNEHLADITQVIVFLLGAMTIVELIDRHQGFRFITGFIRTNDKRILLWEISLITFFVSSVLDNLTTSIIMVTVLRGFIKDKKERMIFASMVVIAANAGGAWTPIGDVTTTMLWIGDRISSGKVMSQLFLPSIISMLVPLAFFSSTVKGIISSEGQSEKDQQILYGAKRVLGLGIGALLMVPVLRACTGLPPYLGILLGLGFMWVLTDRIHQQRHFLRVPYVLTKIDISSVLFFLGILLAVAALESAGILAWVTLGMERYIGNKYVIVSTLGVISAIIDNVPLTAAVMGMYPLNTYPLDSKIWEMTAYCVGTGGSLLIIGSAAGVVVMGMEQIGFGWYLKRVSLPACVGYFLGILVFLLFYH